MAMNIELPSFTDQTKDEEIQLPINDDDNIQENESETKTKDFVGFTEPKLESPDEDNTSTAKAHVASEGNSTRLIGSHEVWHDLHLLSLMLTVMVFIAGGAYTALLNFHEVFPHVDHVKTVNLSTFELFTFPSATTEGFLFLSAATVTFITSMLVILFALCLISRRWSWGLSLAILSMFLTMTMLLNFLAMLNKLVPHFITIGGGHAKVPGVLIVVFYSVYMMVLVPIAFIAQRVINRVSTRYKCKFTINLIF